MVLAVYGPYIQIVTEAVPEGLSNSSTVTITDHWLDCVCVCVCVCVCMCVCVWWLSEYILMYHVEQADSANLSSLFCSNTVLQSNRR